MTDNFLLLNSDKMEILTYWTKKQYTEYLWSQFALDGCPVASSKVKNLGVIKQQLIFLMLENSILPP